MGISAVSKNGKALMWLPESLKADKEVVLVAVKQVKSICPTSGVFLSPLVTVDSTVSFLLSLALKPSATLLTGWARTSICHGISQGRQGRGPGSNWPKSLCLAVNVVRTAPEA